MRKLLIALMVTTAVPALAADIRPAPAKAPTYPVVENAPTWTGFYVGLDAGFGWNHASVDVSGADASSQAVVDAAAKLGVPTSFGPSSSGFVGGGHAGFNYQFGAFVAGLETDAMWTDLKGSSTWDSHIIQLPAASSITIQDKLDWLGTTRARLGWQPLPTMLLLYGTGGVAYGGVNSGGTFKFPPYNVTTSDSSTRVGWTAGAGAEWALAPRWSVRAEWLHYDLGSVAWDVPVAKTMFTGRIDAKNSGELVRGGVSYRF